MKFQNPILNLYLTDRSMDGRTSPKQYAPSTYLKLGASLSIFIQVIKKKKVPFRALFGTFSLKLSKST